MSERQFDFSVSEIEEALARLDKPADGQDPFWRDATELILRSLLEIMRDKARA